MNEYVQQALRELADRGSDPGADTVWERATRDAVDERARRRVRKRRLLASTIAIVGVVSIVVALAVARNNSHDQTLRVSPTTPTGVATAAQLVAGRWSTLPAAPIPSRAGAAVVWSGRELIVWGGATGETQDKLRSDGAAYDPSTNTWRVLPAAPLTARVDQGAVWTGTEMIVWGGNDSVSSAQPHAVNDGAAYSPATDSWRRLSPSPLAPRDQPIAVWTGDEVIVLGGAPAVVTDTHSNFKDGAAYDPTGNRWRMLPTPVPPDGHSLTWAFVVQGGPGRLIAWSEWAASRKVGQNSVELSGGADLFRLDETTSRWSNVAISANPLPTVEDVLWTGTHAIVRGLAINCGYCSHPAIPETTAFFDPTSASWTSLPSDPLQSDHLSSAWTGAALFSFNAGTQTDSVVPGDATVYDPATRRWSWLPRAPTGCNTAAPIWTGQQMLMYCTDISKAATGGASGLVYTPASTTTAGSTTSSCTSADLDARGNVPMPKPEVATHAINYNGGADFADPPRSPRGAEVTANEAWLSAVHLGLVGTSPLGTYRILLADYSTPYGGGINHRLSWLVVGHHVPSIGIGGVDPSGETASRPPCVFADVVDVIDASTGKSLNVTSGNIGAP